MPRTGRRGAASRARFREATCRKNASSVPRRPCSGKTRGGTLKKGLFFRRAGRDKTEKKWRRNALFATRIEILLKVRRVRTQRRPEGVAAREGPPRLLSGGGVRGRGAPSAFLPALVRVAVADPRRPGPDPTWKRGYAGRFSCAAKVRNPRKRPFSSPIPSVAQRGVCEQNHTNNKTKRAIAL